MEDQIESHVRYDDRRKELTHLTKEIKEAKVDDEVIGKVTIESKGIYTEKGIKKILADLENRKVQFEQIIKDLKKETANVPELTDDLKELKEKLTKLQKIDKAEKSITQLKQNELTLTQIKKDLRDIKQEIGSRLKL